MTSRARALAFVLIGCSAPAPVPPRPGVETVPYGAWESPITAELANAAEPDLDEPTFGDDGIYWLEGQAEGRSALMRRSPDGKVSDVLPGIDVRTEAHAYGGGALVIDGPRMLYSNGADQRLYLRDASGTRALTPAGKHWFADCVIDRARDRAICVHEDSTRGMPEDSIVAIDLRGKKDAVVLVRGKDFFAAPRLSPDGKQLAWLAWSLPNMPWTGTELWMAPVAADGALGTPVHVVGGPSESIFQPEWSPDGILYFASDRTGYWNIYRQGSAEPVWRVDAEVGKPAWLLGEAMYGFASPTQIVAAAIDRGVGKLAVIDLPTGKVTPVATPFTLMRGRLAARNGRALMLAASDEHQESVIEVELATGATKIIAGGRPSTLPRSLIVRAEPITFPTKDGGRGYAYYYAPKHDTYRAPAGEKPPLIVRAHGGPTGHSDARLNPAILYWTSRGFAFVDVNYGGSSGYGRAYRERLAGQWGVVDVDDCIAAAKVLVDRGDVDGRRLIIRGGSAGGYTTLAALAFRDVFAAGASWFGIADLEKLDAETKESDKFESGYTQLLVGPYPERRDLFLARSPIYSADKIKAPVIFFQGSDDPVVPANQSRMMHDALKKRGIATEYIEFPGEKHGFRKLENNVRAFRAELDFYRRVLGIRRP